MTDPYENLANAIVLQAVKDYSSALKKLLRYPESKEANHDKASYELFFRSDWFGVLTSVDPELLIEKLQKEAE